MGVEQFLSVVSGSGSWNYNVQIWVQRQAEWVNSVELLTMNRERSIIYL